MVSGGGAVFGNTFDATEVPPFVNDLLPILGDAIFVSSSMGMSFGVDGWSGNAPCRPNSSRASISSWGSSARNRERDST